MRGLFFNLRLSHFVEVVLIEFMVSGSGVLSVPTPDRCALCNACQSFEDWYMRGEELAARQEFQKALRCFEEALILAPEHVSSLLYQAVCLIHLNQPQKALTITTSLLERVTDNAQVHLFHGVALHRLGQYEAAYASYDRAVGQTPRVGLWDRLRHLAHRLQNLVPSWHV
jgi:tetratricopeptide (TPR) repeat protein